MKQQASLLGLCLKIAHQFHHHRLLGIPMDWLAVGIILAGAVVFWRRSETVWAALLAGLAATSLLAGCLAGRADYLVFRPGTRMDRNPAQEPPESDRETRVNATGRFAVHGQERYLVEHPAIYTTPRSREHIVMAKLAPTRLLLLGKSDPEAWGWWYLFFRPEMIESVEMGQAVHGWRIRPALRIVYRLEAEKGHQRRVETILSFENREQCSLIWADVTYEQRASGASR